MRWDDYDGCPQALHWDIHYRTSGPIVNASPLRSVPSRESKKRT